MQDNDKSIPNNDIVATDVKPVIAAPAVEQKASSSAGVIVLQWLTYAFWGWTILSLVWLLYIVFASLFTDSDTSGMVPYAIAAAIVLLPISLICELFYSRIEPIKKQGVATVVMVIHAVIFALFGIGMLILTVFVCVQTAIDSSSASDNSGVWIATLFVSAIVYAFTFLRTLNPTPKLRLRLLYPLVMGIIVGLFIILSVAGPAVSVAKTKNDRLIENDASTVQYKVEDYISKNKKLPASLNELSLSGDARDIVAKNLLTYTADGVIKPDAADVLDSANTAFSTSETKYRYQLCANYTKARNISSYERESTDYQSSISASSHPAGNVCYKLEYTLYK